MAYATLVELREYIGMTDNVSASDTDLTRALAAASARVDGICGRTFATAASATKVYDVGFGYVERVWIDDVSTTAGLVVEQSYDAAGWSAVTGWRLGPVTPYAGFPYTHLEANIMGTTFPGMYARVTGSFGWAAVPDSVKQATLLIAHKLFRRRSSPTGVEGVADFGPVRVSRTDPDVSALLSDYTRRYPGIA